jgi:hypothetical protein
MKDIGKGEGGASLGEASSKIFTAFYDSIIGVVANTTGLAGDALKNLTGGLGDLVGVGDDDKPEKPEEPENAEKKKSGIFRRRIFPR